MTVLSREELEAQLARKSPEWWANAQKMIGKENYYHHRGCHFGLVTVDLHAGTTPMFMKCIGRNGYCSGVMHSMGYPDPASKPAWLGEPTHEWYRPDFIDDDREDEEANHVLNGGLLLRDIKEGDRAQN